MSYNGSGTFVINTSGQPVVTGTVISSTAFNALTADLGTGLSTAITKDGQTTTTAKIPFAQGISAAVASNFAAGTVAAPSIYLSTDTGTGLYRIGANNDGFAISGTKLLDFGSALLGVTGALTVSTTLGVTGASTLAALSATTGAFSGQLTNTAGGTFFVGSGATTGQANMQFSNTGGGAQIGIETSAGGGLITGGLAYATVVGSYTNTAIQLFTNGISRQTISNAGIVTMTAYGAGAATFSAAGVISSVSDETWKIKDGIPTDPDAMLKKLEPGYWYYNEEKKDTFGTDRQLGFYAQNVNAAIGPEAAPIPESIVTKNEDGTETTTKKPWGYYDRSVLAVTVMALQKALATIEILAAKVAQLEAA